LGAGKPSEEPRIAATARHFVDPSPDSIFLAKMSLRQYLTDAGLVWPIRLRDVLSTLDYGAFFEAYTGQGRQPIHPRAMLGLIVYGMLQGQWSLRDLERLAIRDLGAWWVCAGLQPDHSTIGEFIIRHASLLTEGFFEDLTRRLVKRTGGGRGVVAGDGTTIEAAGSRLQALKAEAARAAAQEARAESTSRPDATRKLEVAERREQAVVEVEKRTELAKAKGEGTDPRVCVTEPEAVVQKLKNGSYRPSHKPSVLVNEHRLILAQQVDPSSEIAVVKPMLEQCQTVLGEKPTTLLLDAGYFCFLVFSLAVAKDLDVLCPTGNSLGGRESRKRTKKGLFVKDDFVWDEKHQEYTCPAGKRLAFLKHGFNARLGQAYTEYQCRDCGACPLRSKCTKSNVGRSVKRYEGEELKDAAREVLRHPLARRLYRKRMAMVEPVFAALRERQGLRRFHRRGVTAVRTEFALHCIAYNLGRIVRGGGAFDVLVVHVTALAIDGQHAHAAWQTLLILVPIEGRDR
jgi:transposase